MQCYDCQQCEVRHWNHTTLFVAHYYLQSERGLYEAESPADQMAKLLQQRAEVLRVPDYNVVDFVYGGSPFTARMRAVSSQWLIRGRNAERKVKDLDTLFQILNEVKAMEDISPDATDEQCRTALREKYGEDAVKVYNVYRKGAFKNKTPREAYLEVISIAEWS